MALFLSKNVRIRVWGEKSLLRTILRHFFLISKTKICILTLYILTPCFSHALDASLALCFLTVLLFLHFCFAHETVRIKKKKKRCLFFILISLVTIFMPGTYWCSTLFIKIRNEWNCTVAIEKSTIEVVGLGKEKKSMKQLW